MSIINKMLQDLDDRSGRSGGEAVAGEAVRSIKPVSPWHLGRNIFLLAFGVVVLSSLAAAWWLNQPNRGAAGSLAAAPAPPVPTPVKAPQPAAAPMPPAAAAPEAPIANVALAAPAAVQPAGVSAPAPAAPAVAASAVAAPAPVVAPASAGAPAIASNKPGRVEAAAPQSKPVSTGSKATGGKTYSSAQVSANLLGEAVTLDQQGRQEEAKAPLRRALASDALDVKARQMLIQLHLDTGHVEEARALLAEGQRLSPEQSNFTFALARLKVESGDLSGAIQLLDAGRSGARNEPQYHAFLAALLLRVQRHEEAVQDYLVALRSDPANTSWLVGVGVALEGVGNVADAVEAYRRANGAANLTPELANFLSERLARLGR